MMRIGWIKEWARGNGRYAITYTVIGEARIRELASLYGELGANEEAFSIAAELARTPFLKRGD